MRRFSKMLSLLVLGSVFFFFTDTLAQDRSRVSADTLASLLEKALEAFSRNDFAEAANLFHRLDREFATEPELRDENFLRRMLPLRGHAEFASGQTDVAIATLTRFVDTFPTDSQHPAALLTLASALRANHQSAEAVQRFRQFEESYPHRPEAGLALAERATILLETDPQTPALDLLLNYCNGPAPAAIRHQVRLRAARLALQSENSAASISLLLDQPWDLTTFPEISTLSFLALELGDKLMEASDPANAIRAYRLVLPRSEVLIRQKERIAEIEEKLARFPSGPDHFWRGFYHQLHQKLIGQLTTLETGDDYSPFLLLRRGQAYLLHNRPHEAWLLFEHLALDTDIPTTVREEAHYRWIIAASQLEIWEEALTVARNFVARYPEADLAPQALFLIGQAHQEQRRYSESAVVLTDIITRFPDHPLAQRWQFTRGFNFTLLEKFDEARSDFAQASKNFPKAPLTANCQLWHALTHFFQRHYPEALAEFDILAKQYESHPLAGEILYRRAATLYAMRDHDRAEKAAAHFTDQFAHHPRHTEALVLLGDIRMGAGALDQAMATFASIPPETGHLFLYGLFQRGKILRAESQYEEMISLFTRYAKSTDSSEKPRLSEALYWIGWAQAQLDRPADAVPVFLEAIQRYGNEPGAGEIASILRQLETLAPHLTPERDFPQWLEKQRQLALSQNRLSYFARLNLHQAQTLVKQKNAYQAEALLFEIANQVPLAQLGPDALGPVGHLLISKDLSSGREFLLRLLKEYPAAPERAFAFHGLGKRALAENLPEEALRSFRRFLQETPVHPLSGEVMQLTGETLLRLERYPEASEQFEEILRQRTLRGRPHAEALIGLARVHHQAEEPEKSIAYFQRVYTVHRAQPDLVAEAYLESALLFEQLGKPAAARATLEEMLTLPELTNQPHTSQARKHLQNLPTPAPLSQTSF